MTDRPILFSGEMVRAILDGRKTQTRRGVKPQPITEDKDAQLWSWHNGAKRWDTSVALAGYRNEAEFRGQLAGECPYGQPGDRLWVREACIISPKRFDGIQSDSYNVRDREGDGRICQYVATSPDTETARECYGLKVTPSIHMPRWASRLPLEITNVRVERLCDISDDGARAEGYGVTTTAPDDDGDRHFIKPRDAFLCGAWASPLVASNPWVWVIEFRSTPHEGAPS